MYICTVRYYCGAILLDLRVGTLLEEEEEEELYNQTRDVSA